jgi:hypothetical protein
MFGIIAFYVEYRKSRKDKGYDTYIQTILSWVDLEKLLIQHPELQSLYEYNKSYKELPKERRKNYHWFSMFLGIVEIVFIASPRDRKWMSRDEWEGWDEWISELINKSEDFRLTWKMDKNYYCEKFRNYMDEKIQSSA